MNDSEKGKISIFYSYSHSDEAFRERLEKSLSSLRKDGLINEWHDRKIKAGDEWEDEIDKYLNEAKIVLFLISPDFIHSDYCMGVEVKRAIERHWERRCRIIPVILKPADWSQTEFHSFQALPKDAKPIVSWKNQDDAFSDIAAGIQKVCKNIVDWENSYRRASVGDWTETEGTMIVKETGQKMLINTYLEVVEKNQDLVIVQSRATLNGVPQTTPTMEIPLDSPIDDNMGALLKQLGEQMPQNAELEKNELGRGEQKIFIGDKVYYSSWFAFELKFTIGFEQFVMNGKNWKCIDVPLDGIVKGEIDNPIYSQRTVLLDYGWS